MRPWGRLMRRGKSPLDRWNEVADLRRGRDFFRTWSRHRHIARRPLLKQEFGGLDDRFGMETVPDYPLVQDIRDRDQRHALVMRHIGPHDRDALLFRNP